MAVGQKLFQNGGVLAEIFIAITEIIIARPKPHLAVFRTLPAGNQDDAEAAAGDGVDGCRHARDDGRRHDQRRGRAEQLDLGGDGSEARHQREGFQIIVPEFGLAAEAAQLDHR
ncbi:hypothetical protein D3C80_1756740 [compost metagenome]